MDLNLVVNELRQFQFGFPWYFFSTSSFRIVHSIILILVLCNVKKQKLANFKKDYTFELQPHLIQKGKWCMDSLRNVCWRTFIERWTSRLKLKKGWLNLLHEKIWQLTCPSSSRSHKAPTFTRHPLSIFIRSPQINNIPVTMHNESLIELLAQLPRASLRACVVLNVPGLIPTLTVRFASVHFISYCISLLP